MTSGSPNAVTMLITTSVYEPLDALLIVRFQARLSVEGSTTG